jgi:hypothetical protein
LNLIKVPVKFANVIQKWKGSTVCSDPECRYSRAIVHRFSHDNGSIQIQGSRYCFPVCFNRVLLQKIRQLATYQEETPAPSHRIPLGLLMLSRGDVDAAQLHKALDAQRQSGSGNIGEWLLTLGFVQEEQIMSALASQWACPILRVFPQTLANSPVPLAILEAFRMAPAYNVARTKTLYMAFAGKIEYRALLSIEETLQCKAIPCMTSRSMLTAALARFCASPFRADQHFESVRNPEEMARISSSYAEKLGAVNVQLTACGRFVWCRIDAMPDYANLVFPRALDHPAIIMAAQPRTVPVRPPANAR